ncbi:MAG: helix-turn-helix transcriptional regulator [Clostridia bacterium]|nr:helix-turn-helix transcriptional regulator [Clostridia bacterium]
MFFSSEDLSLEILGVFKLNRTNLIHETVGARSYDSISIRLSGCGHFETSTDVFDVKSGDVLYLPGNEMYRQNTDGESVIAIHFINNSFNGRKKAEKVSPLQYSLVEKTIVSMYDEWNKKIHGYRYKCISMLYNVLYLIYSDSFENKIAENDNRKYSKAIEYIHANYRSSSVRISHLARMCTMSETYFREGFSKIFGKSPLRYINDMRLEYAVQLLQSDFFTVCEVSEKSGFSDPKYFSRIFSKKYGCPPSQFSQSAMFSKWK